MMKTDRQIIFPPFRLDRSNQRLFQGQQEIALRPKTFALLEYLLERAGQLITKSELLDAVWPDTSVTDAVLKVSIREIRDALGDDATTPRFIETAHRTGYRFIGELARNNLPVQLTNFIGREREIAEVKRLLGQTRLLTLTGAGGSGKSRLAIEVANEAASEFEDAVRWVELAALSDETLIPQAVATALGVREQPGRALIETLSDYLRSKNSLLVLDNCEHLITACAAFADTLLRSSAQLKILATSRESLGVAGEVTWLVPPMSLPDPDRLPPFDDLLNYESVRLFIDRASASLPAFKATTENAPALSEVCHKLDGIPLAIELAAARVKVLAVEQIAARLDNCFRLLAAGSRTVLPRHQTLRATIDWSYDLLSEDERALLCRLSAFAGGFTLEAAEEVCAYERITREDVFDLLSHLVDRSLVVVTQRVKDGQTRYRLLETVRQYAHEKLLEADGASAVEHRHASFFLRLAEEAEPNINTPERSEWLARLDGERDNLRAALGYAIELKETETALRMVGSLLWHWFHRGYWTEGRGWIKQTLSLPRATERTRLRASALYGEGLLAWAMGDHRTARAQLEESADLWREVGDRRGLAHTLHFLGVELLAHGELELARSMGEESVAIFRELKHDRFGLSVSCASLGIIAMTQEDYRAAQPLLEESVAISRESKDNWAMALPLRNLGIMAFRNGDYDKAVELLKESLAALRDLNEKWFVSRSIESLAEALALKGECERAARLFGAGEALREAIGASVLPFYRADYDCGIAAVRERLDEKRLAAVWDEGRKMAMDEAIAYALAGPKRSRSSGA